MCVYNAAWCIYPKYKQPLTILPLVYNWLLLSGFIVAKNMFWEKAL